MQTWHHYREIPAGYLPELGLVKALWWPSDEKVRTHHSNLLAEVSDKAVLSIRKGAPGSGFCVLKTATTLIIIIE